jgi:hypothetical protein
LSFSFAGVAAAVDDEVELEQAARSTAVTPATTARARRFKGISIHLDVMDFRVFRAVLCPREV